MTSTRPLRYPPGGAWPVEVRADMAAAETRRAAAVEQLLHAVDLAMVAPEGRG